MTTTSCRCLSVEHRWTLMSTTCDNTPTTPVCSSSSSNCSSSSSSSSSCSSSSRVQYKLAVTVHRCLQHRAPGYLADYCMPVSEVPGRQHLRSARRYQLLVPRVRRGTFGTRAFSVAGPTVWNSLPDCLRYPAVDSEQFRRDLKTYLFAGHSRR